MRENRNLSTLPLGGKAVVGKRELPSLAQLPTVQSVPFYLSDKHLSVLPHLSVTTVLPDVKAAVHSEEEPCC